MTVRLRLSRIGKKKTPFYRIVAIDSRKSRDGEAIDILGTYDGLKGFIVKFDENGIKSWIKKGAQMSDSVRKIYKMAKKQGFFVEDTVKDLAIDIKEEAQHK
jgi:small subunit ribosomal protein S16